MPGSERVAAELTYTKTLRFDSERERDRHELRLAYGDVVDALKAAAEREREAIAAWLREHPTTPANRNRDECIALQILDRWYRASS